MNLQQSGVLTGSKHSQERGIQTESCSSAEFRRPSTELEDANTGEIHVAEFHQKEGIHRKRAQEIVKLPLLVRMLYHRYYFSQSREAE